MTLADEKYLSATTFRASGAAVSTPVWIVALDGGRMGFWTASTTGKVKRLRRDPRITLQPSDSRGRIRDGTEEVTGTAVIVSSGSEFDAIQSAVRAKYGFMTKITKVLGKLAHVGKGGYPYADTGVVITLNA